MISIDTTQIGTLARDLKRAADKEVIDGFKKGMKSAAAIVSVRAKSLIDPYSTTIPRTVRPFATLLRSGVRAGNGNMPIAGLMEYGSKNNPGRIRHPLFGDTSHWYSQPAHPYLHKAAEQTEPAWILAVTEDINQSLQRVNL